MGNVFIDAVSSNRRRLADELRVAAATTAGRQFRGSLLAGADMLCSDIDVRRDVTLVLGEELGDGVQCTWVVCGYEQARQAQSLAARLNEVVASYGRSIGNMELVGLEHRQRRELESHLRQLDPAVQVGRHGVRWYVLNSVLNPR